MKLWGGASMKLVSPKNLLVSLLGCAFVVLKIVTFDGIVDLFWILFIGYLSVKCLAAGLSQEAHNSSRYVLFFGKTVRLIRSL